MVAGRAWAHPSLLWQAARDFVYAGGLVLVGISLGRSTQAPDVAVRRAVRAFALLCVILVVAALAGSEPGWGAAAVVTSIAAGGLLVAVARYGDLIELVDPAERMPALPWLLAVAGAVLVVVAAGALLSVVLRADAVLWALHALGGVLRFALDGIAFAIGYAGATLARGLAWVLGLLHVHPWHAKWVPPQAPKPPVAAPYRHGSGFKFPGTAKLAGMIAGAVLVIGGLLALVALALRRVRREAPAEASVLEEREELTSLRSAAGQFAGRLGRRLRSRLGGMLHREPVTPAERVRRRYAELERRLTGAGQPRPIGVTVREYLASVEREAGPRPDPSAGHPQPEPSTCQPLPAADLAGLYELARYSGHFVDTAQAERFEALALVFGA